MPTSWSSWTIIWVCKMHVFGSWAAPSMSGDALGNAFTDLYLWAHFVRVETVEFSFHWSGERHRSATPPRCHSNRASWDWKRWVQMKQLKWVDDDTLLAWGFCCSILSSNLLISLYSKDLVFKFYTEQSNYDFMVKFNKFFLENKSQKFVDFIVHLIIFSTS